MKFLVPVKTVITQVYKVEAESKFEAMNLALEDADLADNCCLVHEDEGDAEVYYPDITEVRE